MLFDTAQTSQIRPWLVQTLEPICDADPEVLADYVLALLKHEAPEAELRTMFTSQLRDFLEKEAPNFVDKLFSTLRSRNYVNESAPVETPAVDTGIPIPLASLITSPTDTRGHKRSLEHDDGPSRAPPKGPRMSDGQVSRYGPPNGRLNGSNRDERWRGGPPVPSGPRANRSMSPPNRYENLPTGPSSQNGMGPRGDPMNGQGSGRNGLPRRGRCRDYHNLGYCARGAHCPYSHGDDPLVPGAGMIFPPQGVPLNGAVPGAPPMMGMMPGFPMPWMMGQGMDSMKAQYDPNESRMDVTTPPVTNARAAPEEFLVKTDAEKNAAGDVLKDGPTAYPQHPFSNNHNRFTETPGRPNGPQFRRGGRGDMRGMGRGRGTGGDRGTFAGDRASFQSQPRTDKTLVVEKIPADKLSLDAVNTWFKRFGTVTNVAIDQSSAKALVSFNNHDEAHAAWKCEDAVFGNRFVKVFWHRPMEGQGQIGARALAASAPLVQQIAQPSTSMPPPTPVKKSTPLAPSTPAATPSKAQLLERQIAEQKALFARLSTATGEEKTTLKAQIKKLGEEMKAVTVSASTPKAPPAVSVDERAKQERERLDRELDIHSVATKLDDNEPSSSSGREEELKAQLAKLRAEAAKIGLSDESISSSQPSYSGYNPYGGRGRGRGRGSYFRGRGGPPRTSMKLDLRPRVLSVKGFQEDDPSVTQAIKDWYESNGDLETFETVSPGEIRAQFKTRMAAEQALAKGSSIPLAGTVRIAWHTNAPAVPVPAPTEPSPATSPVPAPEPELVDENVDMTYSDNRRSLEREVDGEDADMGAGGWGGFDE
ncbi:hypothetical protein BOTBODRAFT_62234 [Botryobasidium botryosum FD-172 SS1]|uniref:C3H1-type domain-containing protein n=1 Tax=Botryobasidium botryosum (strain FD-172 SS1) TaxID=930990 RepID=A0A067N7X2_BOTB1|nr:hypothetical protein BOTBODRAFT_62234 [Botryobasidium botryosum FD-172 SS1]